MISFNIEKISSYNSSKKKYETSVLTQQFDLKYHVNHLDSTNIFKAINIYSHLLINHSA